MPLPFASERTPDHSENPFSRVSLKIRGTARRIANRGTQQCTKARCTDRHENGRGRTLIGKRCVRFSEHRSCCSRLSSFCEQLCEARSSRNSHDCTPFPQNPPIRHFSPVRSCKSFRRPWACAEA
jgi:hypothetical protein